METVPLDILDINGFRGRAGGGEKASRVSFLPDGKLQYTNSYTASCAQYILSVRNKTAIDVIDMVIFRQNT